jgi:hypothetical protein
MGLTEIVEGKSKGDKVGSTVLGIFVGFGHVGRRVLSVGSAVVGMALGVAVGSATVGGIVGAGVGAAVVGMALGVEVGSATVGGIVGTSVGTGVGT